MCSMSIETGDFVRLDGLLSSAQYNNLIGLVIGERNNEGRYPVQLLDHQRGWVESNPDPKLECAGKVLIAKESNLHLSEDSEHWKTKLDNSSIQEIITSTTVGDHEYCEEFVKSVWDKFFETVPAMLLDEKALRMIASDTELTGRKIFWICCEAIMHHFLIEKCRGRYRIYQAYVGGYTSREWCSAGVGVGSNAKLHSNPTWKRFGGGRTVGRKDIRVLLDAIAQMQDLIPSLTPHLLQHIEGLTQKDVDIIALVQSGAPRQKMLQMKNRIEEILHICMLWTYGILNNMEGKGITTLGVFEDGNGKLICLPETDKIQVVQEHQTIFEIPVNLYKKVQQANQNLTGQVYLNPAIFVKILNCGGLLWKFTRNPADGESYAFGYRGATLDWDMSFEDGISRAEEIRRIIKKGS